MSISTLDVRRPIVSIIIVGLMFLMSALKAEADTRFYDAAPSASVGKSEYLKTLKEKPAYECFKATAGARGPKKAKNAKITYHLTLPDATVDDDGVFDRLADKTPLWQCILKEKGEGGRIRKAADDEESE